MGRLEASADPPHGSVRAVYGRSVWSNRCWKYSFAGALLDDAPFLQTLCVLQVLYVEEDNYVAPDVLTTLHQMIELAKSGGAGCAPPKLKS